MARNFFFISTGHHVAQVKDAIEYFGLSADSCVVFVVRFDVEPDAYDWVYELRDIAFVEEVSYWRPKELLYRFREPRRFSKNLRRRWNDESAVVYTSLYHLDIARLVFHAFEESRYVVLDEGTASFRVLHERASESSNSGLYLRVKQWIYGGVLARPDSVTYFSKYHLRGIGVSDDLILYRSPVKPLMEGRQVDKKVIILGSSIYCVPNKIIDIKSYTKIINSVMLEIEGVHGVEYWMHRKETVTEVRKFIGPDVTLIVNREPFEKAYAELSVLPSKIYSFLSPTLNSLSQHYESHPYFAVFVPAKESFIRDAEIFLNIAREFELNDRLSVIYCGVREDD